VRRWEADEGLPVHRHMHRIENARGATPAREQLRGQRVLVVGQVAMALVLLVASGLMVRTLLAIQSVKPGFTRPDHIQMVRISLPQVLAREPERVIRLQKDMLDRLAAIPGVAAVGFASTLPLENNRNGVAVAIEGVTEPDRSRHLPEIVRDGSGNAACRPAGLGDAPAIPGVAAIQEFAEIQRICCVELDSRLLLS